MFASEVEPRKRAAVHVAQGEIHEEGEGGDPHHVRDDDVHRQIAAHQEDPIAEPDLGGDRLGGDQEQPGRTERQPQAVEEPRQHLRNHDAGDDLPGREPEGLRLDELLGGQLLDPQREIAHQERRDADDDQHHLGQLAEAEDDEEDRQQRHRRHHRRDRDQWREAGADVGNQARGDADDQAEDGGDEQAEPEALQAGGGVGPQQDVARARVGLDRHAADRVGERSRRSAATCRRDSPPAAWPSRRRTPATG